MQSTFVRFACRAIAGFPGHDGSSFTPRWGRPDRIDPSRIAGHDAIAFNRSWLAWPAWGFAPRYHACLDADSIAILAPELPEVISAHAATHFFLHRNARAGGIATGRNVTLCTVPEAAGFTASASMPADLGNVGASSMQILAVLGYRRILMVGVDGEYRLETGVKTDANHFRDDYARGRVPLSPALRARYAGRWETIAEACGERGIEVRNASPGSVLTCFEQVEFEDGLTWLSEEAAPRREHAGQQGLRS